MVSKRKNLEEKLIAFGNFAIGKQNVDFLKNRNNIAGVNELDSRVLKFENYVNLGTSTAFTANMFLTGATAGYVVGGTLGATLGSAIPVIGTYAGYVGGSLIGAAVGGAANVAWRRLLSPHIENAGIFLEDYLKEKGHEKLGAAAKNLFTTLAMSGGVGGAGLLLGASALSSGFRYVAEYYKPGTWQNALFRSFALAPMAVLSLYGLTTNAIGTPDAVHQPVHIPTVGQFLEHNALYIGAAAAGKILNEQNPNKRKIYLALAVLGAAACSGGSTPTVVVEPTEFVTQPIPPTVTPYPTAVIPPTVVPPTADNSCIMVPGTLDVRYVLDRNLQGSGGPGVSFVQNDLTPVEQYPVHANVHIDNVVPGSSATLFWQMTGDCAPDQPIIVRNYEGVALPGTFASLDQNTGRYSTTINFDSGSIFNYNIQIPHGSSTDDIALVVSKIFLPDNDILRLNPGTSNGNTVLEYRSSKPWAAGNYYAVMNYDGVDPNSPPSGSCSIYAQDPKILLCKIPNIPPFNINVGMNLLYDVPGTNVDYPINGTMTFMLIPPPTPIPNGGGGDDSGAGAGASSTSSGATSSGTSGAISSGSDG